MIAPIPTSHSNPLLPHYPPLPTLHQQHKRKREQQQQQQVKMCQTPEQQQQQRQQQQTTIPHSSPSPQFQFHPTTPEKSTHFSPPPSLLQRMQRDKCFSCKELGHWTKNCPHKTPNNNNNNKTKNKPDSANQLIWCRCGYGFCGSKESHSEKNYGRWYFTCPITRGARCNWVKWCDDLILESDLRPPLMKYPECGCGAGVCRKVTETGQCCYFTCPVKKSHGSCGYRVLEYELLNKARNDEPVNNTSVVPIQQSRHRDLNETFEGDQTDTTVKNLANDLAESSDLLLTTKRMRIKDGSENPSPVAVSEIPEGKCGGSPIEVVVISEIPEGKCGGSPVEMANSQPVGFPEIVFEDDIELINLASWDEIEAEARFSTPSRISCRQNVFQKDIFSADASFGIFPLFNPTVVPTQTSTIINSQSQSECRDVAIKSPNQCTQLSPGSEEKLKAVERGILIGAQKRLLDDLENLDFHQHESMRWTAEATFLALNRLGLDCKQFSDYVWDFINLATSMADIDKSMENFPTLEEQSKLLEEAKVRLANIKVDCMKTEALLQSSNQKRKLLSEEVSRLEALLREKQNELKFCDLETVKFETRLGDVKRRMLDADETVEDRILQTEAARIKVAERHTKEIAARIALDNAKHALGN